ncbi:MAG: hypothetical protein AAGA61_09380, partial [Pseudomonadota bacterium]
MTVRSDRTLEHRPRVAGRRWGYRLLAAGLVSAALGVNPVAASADQSPDSASSAAREDRALQRGKILFLQCRACHSLMADDGHRVGPNLAGLFGREA